MKIGRNDPCPCGSGKKFKKCCMNEQAKEKISYRNYFQLKGMTAEKFVHELASKTFLIDWCFLNPKLPNNKELCDLLVVYDDIAIIWQIKNLKLGKDGKYNKSEVEKNLRQLSGARRNLFELKIPFDLVNQRRSPERFDPSTIKEVYLISVLVGDGEDNFFLTEKTKDHIAHIFTGEFTQKILTELDTISDFISYLREKEAMVTRKNIIILGGEEELLAYYLLNDKNFKKFNHINFITIEDGSWKQLQNNPKYKAKKIADEISYGWDDIINRAHKGSPKYELVARELARPNRFERRYLSKVFFEAHLRANSDKTHDLFRRVLPCDDISYCFLFQKDLGQNSAEKRKQMLSNICLICRYKFPKNKKVIGIATEMEINQTCSYDFCLLNIPKLTKEGKKDIKELQEKTKILLNPIIKQIQDQEYPDI